MTKTHSGIVCFSHLRWSFVFQRPQHLMSRFAHHGRVYFFEEAVFEEGTVDLRCVTCPKTGVHVVTPVLPIGMDVKQSLQQQHLMLKHLLTEQQMEDFVAWFYTPMAVPFTRGTHPSLTVYDCMDELSAFAGAHAAMKQNEEALLDQADLVFTGGSSLYEAKKGKHSSLHLFPSSVEVAHFAKALLQTKEPVDQQSISRPRLGYAGVIDERMDLVLLAQLAESRPDWQIVMVGPVVKIDPQTLPKAKNIHYLGMKGYDDLPAYLAGWDVAMLPFARNESTRFISPTKTPEYLAAGLPVISTPIRDVVHPYGDLGLVAIAEDAQQFVAAAERLLRAGRDPSWRADVKAFLDRLSWDATWGEMNRLMEEKLARKALANANALSMAAGVARV